MQQRRRTAAFDAILMAHFAYRNDVLISGDGYLRPGAPPWVSKGHEAGYLASSQRVFTLLQCVGGYWKPFA